MVLGMSTSTFTLVHVLLSLVGIGSGFMVVVGLLNSKLLNSWTAIFLATTVLTSVTGLLFPITHITPGIILGILSLLVLTPAILARYAFHLRGAWRSAYIVTAMVALYFNCLVLVVQSFEKVPALRALAPTQKEPPFAVAQLALLATLVVLGVLAVKRFQLESAAQPTKAIA
jgi:hypothetical protein